MSVINTFEHFFSRDVRDRGRDYFVRGYVKAGAVIPFSKASFVVTGSSPYSVEFDFEGSTNRMNWSCTCPHFEEGNNCKHIWASLLAAEKKEFFGPVQRPTARSVSLKKAGNGDLETLSYFQTLKDKAGVQDDDRLSLYEEYPKVTSREVIYVLDLKEIAEYGHPYLRFYCRGIYDNGSVGDLVPRSISKTDLRQYKSPQDRAIIKAIFSVDRHDGYYSYSDYPKNFLELHSESKLPALKMISKARKLFYFDQKKNLIPLQFDSASATSPARLRVIARKFDDHFEVTADLKCGPKKLKLNKKLIYFEPFVLCEDTLYFSELATLENWLATFQQRPKTKLKPQEFPTFLSTLYAKEKTPEIVVPAAFRYRTTKGVSKVRLIIDKALGTELLSASLEYKYGEYYIEPDEASFRILDHDNKLIHVRDLEQELKHRQHLYSNLGRIRPNSNGRLLFNNERLLDLIAKAFHDKWEVVAFKKLVSQSREYKLKASSGIDWFDLGMEMNFANGQTITLPDLLRNIRSGNKLVTLADGTLGVLNDEVIKKFSQLGLGVKIVNGKVRLSKAQALFFSASLSDDENFSADQKFHTLKKVRALSRKPIASSPDPKFEGKLRGYQKKGLGWLESMTAHAIGCLLADDMGLGKTVCVLALLSKRLKEQALIVVPKSLVHNWIDEAKKFVPHLKVHAHFGGGRHDFKHAFRDADIVITTYHTLRNDIEFFKNKKFEYLIVDEAQFIKNPEADVHRSCRLISAEKKLALTGTPIENSLGDMFSILNVIAPGLITKEAWNKHADADDPAVLSNISKAISPFVLRRKKEEVLKDLPKKTEQVVYCELSPSEKRDYDHLKKFLWASLKGKIDENGINKVGSQILVALLRLRQAACHQGVLKKRKAAQPSSKFQVLIEYLDTILAEGHKVLVFSSFAQVLKLLRKELRSRKIDHEYMDGSTGNRKAIVKSFQEDPQKQVFLVTLKTGGVGLNLTAANYVFILDPWWNPAAESQAIDRTHRIGQKSKVTAYKLIAKDTVEEKVIALQAKKRAIAKAIVEGGDQRSVLRGITKEELELLFS